MIGRNSLAIGSSSVTVDSSSALGKITRKVEKVRFSKNITKEVQANKRTIPESKYFEFLKSKLFPQQLITELLGSFAS